MAKINNSKMRLLFVIDYLGPGGAQRQLVTLALGLKSLGFQIEFFTYIPQNNFFQDNLNEAGIIVHEISKTSRYSRGPVITLRKMLATREYDLVLSYLDTPNFYAELSILGTSVPLVVSERNAYRRRKPSLKKWILEQFHRFAQKVIVNSYYQYDNMLKTHPWMKKKLKVIYNGLDLRQFKPDSYSQQQMNEIICVGSVIPRKNSLSLAKAMKICKEHYMLDPVIHWYGETNINLNDNSAYRETQLFLKENNLLENWYWNGIKKNMQDIYPRYQVLIHPSYLEGLSNVIMEAMACGLPVLAGNICETPRIISEGVTGFLFEPNDSSSIANAILRFSQLEINQREKMGENARLKAEELFRIEKFITNYETLIKILL